MSSPKKISKALVFAIVAVLTIVVLIVFRLLSEEESERFGDRIAAVAVAPVEHRSIELKRTFSGALESHSKFVVAPKVAGRIVELPVDISDSVSRGDVVAILDAAEFDQDVRQSEADLAVAEANLAEAKSSYAIAERSYQRSNTLRERGIASESEYDNVRAELLAREAQVKVAEAQTIRAESSLASARIRLSYTRITADWPGGEDSRVVAERYIDEGETVSANDPLLLIVELDPITAVFFVTERDYGLLSQGQPANIRTDAFPNQTFIGKIDRISPVFRENSRQARVELSLENPNSYLKPGMFVRAEITLQRVEETTVIPYAAITRRGPENGVFLVAPDGESVSWQPVTTGIRSGSFVQVFEADLDGKVVTLGQHLLDDGSPITIPDASDLDLSL